MLKPERFIYYPILVFVTACASISPPEGGEKDIKAPELISSSPARQALRVTGKTVTLEFDEDVRLKDFNRQLIITPNTGNTIISEVNRNRVKLEFEKDFEPNTTYFLNLREGIEDITEGNKPKNLSLTFSTGTFLDSGRVQGNVRDLLTGLPEKDINVILYAATDTLDIRKTKPIYLTKTTETGDYQLQNIKDGTYSLFAHTDKNNDNIYNDEREKIAYLSGPITINAKTPAQDLQTLRLYTKKPYVTSQQAYLDEYQLNYNEGITAVKITGNNAPDLVSLNDKNPKIIRLFPATSQTKGRYLVMATDSANNSKVDTLQINFEGKKAKRSDEFTVINKTPKWRLNDNIQLQFDVPLKLTNGPLFTMLEDSVTKRTLNFPDDIKINETKNILSFKLDTKAKKTVTLISDTTRLLPVSGDRFKKQIIQYALTEQEQSGSIKLDITTNYKSYNLELLDKDFKVLRSFSSPKSLLIENLEPNSYRLRVKIDEDGDGTWRAGNPDLKTMPEKVVNRPELIEIKINWLQEISFDF